MKSYFDIQDVKDAKADLAWLGEEVRVEEENFAQPPIPHPPSSCPATALPSLGVKTPWLL